MNRHSSCDSLCTATLAANELTTGTLLHSIKVPLTGTLMSLMQGFILSLFVSSHREDPTIKSMPYLASMGAALLKALGPSGKKITPMIAISMQGCIFALGLQLIGVNMIGVILASMLASLWAFVQPTLIGFVMVKYGLSTQTFERLVLGWQKLTGTDSQTAYSWFITSVCILIVLKTLIAATLGAWAWTSPHLIDGIQRRFSVYKFKSSQDLRCPFPSTGAQRILMALQLTSRQLRSGFFWISMGVTTILLWYADQNISEIMWIGLRLLAGTVALSMFVNLVVLQMVNRLSPTHFLTPLLALQQNAGTKREPETFTCKDHQPPSV